MHTARRRVAETSTRDAQSAQEDGWEQKANKPVFGFRHIYVECIPLENARFVLEAQVVGRRGRVRRAQRDRGRGGGQGRVGVEPDDADDRAQAQDACTLTPNKNVLSDGLRSKRMPSRCTSQSPGRTPAIRTR